MIDVWSKRGVVLLNVSPKSNGVIIEEQRSILRGLGEWMKTYGEAVYQTRPHTVFGYGDAKIKEGHFGGQAATIKFSAKDIRFTRSIDGKSVYVFLLGQPEAGATIAVKHLADLAVADVSVLGGDKCQWKQADGLLNIVAPAASKTNEIATVFKVQLN